MALCRSKATRFLGPNVYPEAPDGGWGWVVAVAFFFVEAFTYGTIKSFGIFLQDLMEEFGETNSRVSWIVSICVFVMTFNAPLSSVLTNRFGFQLVVMLGGILISSGAIATSLCSSINQMYLTYGLITGMGYCLTFLPTVTILSHYFNRRRSLVTATASIGESLAIFALAPGFSALRDHIGWRRTMAVMGALQSIIIICGALLRPIIIKPLVSTKELEALSTQEKAEDTNPEDSMTNKTSLETNTSYSLDNEQTTGSGSIGDSGFQSLKDTDSRSPDENVLLHKEERLETEQTSTETEDKMVRDAGNHVMKEEESKSGDKKLPGRKFKLLDFTILSECSFVLYSMFGLFATLGFFAPQLYIIELSVSRGVERDYAAYMLSTMAMAEILGRFTIGWILTRKLLRARKLLVLLACVIVMTVNLVGFTLITEFYGLAVCSAVYGFFLGTIACTHIPMLAEDDVVGIDRMSSAAGVYVFIQSFAGLAGPPLGGVLVDVTKNYGSAFYSCAAGMAISAVFLGLVKPARKGLLCRKRSFKDPEEVYEKNTACDKDGEEHKLDNRTNSPNNCSKSDDNNQSGATTDAEVIRFA